MALYSEKVMDHFRNPRNVGVLEDANGVGTVGNAKCGDIMKMYLKIEDDITDAEIGEIIKSVKEVVEYLRGFSPIWRDLVAGKKQFIL